MAKESSGAGDAWTGRWPGLAAGLVSGQEERWRTMSVANARLMRGMMAVWQQEMELGQQLMAENFADPKMLGEALAGGLDVKTQWSAAHRRFERTLMALRKINDEFYDCLFDVAAMASGEAAGNGAAEPAPGVGDAAPAREARAGRGH